jgi:hypothetical protein
MTRHEFHNQGWELRGVNLSKLVWLAAGNHTISVEWLVANGLGNGAPVTLTCSWYNDTRQIHVVEL